MMCKESCISMFAGLDELKAQIARDKEEALK